MEQTKIYYLKGYFKRNPEDNWKKLPNEGLKVNSNDWNTLKPVIDRSFPPYYILEVTE